MSDSQVQPPRFIQRELSWLAFNARVLEEAGDVRVPLAERAKFLAIVASNLDEFMMIRFARLLQQREASGRGDSEYAASELLSLVRATFVKQVHAQYSALAELLGRCKDIGVELVRRDAWSSDERLSMQAHFREALEPMLTPLTVGVDQPLPLVPTLRLYLAVEMQREGDGEEPETRFGLVAVPTNEARLVALGGGRFAFIDDVIAHSVEDLFPGWQVRAHAAFRVTRDALLDMDEDHVVDLLTELEEGLWVRAHGASVRLEAEASAPQRILDWLGEELEIETQDMVLVDGPLDLTFLFGAARLGPALEARQFKPNEPAPCPIEFEEPFAALQQRSLLLHHPYQSFGPVVDLVDAASRDPRVVAIKQTLYRVSGESPLVQSLIAAAARGKQVTVLCELRARFDERRNIAWAKRLEQAGATVLYGVLGYKVHSKLLLIVRREDRGIRRYAHIGTGNYNDKTALLYEDFSYFTADEAVCRDVSNLFNMLTGFSRPPKWERLLVAPLVFRSRMHRWIAFEARRAKAGEPARIFAKMNSLVDEQMCEELYAASQAGVHIDLVVRGMCILRPGVPGLSENIRVTSVVGRFLEHSRLYFFLHGGRGIYVIGSGDWMTRNLDHRVECLVEVTEPEFRSELEAVIQEYLGDKRNSRQLGPDGTYRRLLEPPEDTPGVQDRLMQRAQRVVADQQTGQGPATFRPARKPSRDVYG
jgi:polyphosphate kinase